LPRLDKIITPPFNTIQYYDIDIVEGLKTSNTIFISRTTRKTLTSKKELRNKDSYSFIMTQTNTKSMLALATSILLSSYTSLHVNAFAIMPMKSIGHNHDSYNTQMHRTHVSSALFADATDTSAPAPTPTARPSEGMVADHQEPEDAILHVAPKAMVRLRELQKQSKEEIVLRMGVRNGGCSGLSYIMDFSSRQEIQEDDQVDEYPDENIVCVVDAKSMLYLYGLELDYSDELIGGGFKFFNPNAEESCGCGSSFGV
jgi:iron-sulfur cluster assembly protein